VIDRAAYRAWKEAVFGTEYMIWHDGLNTEAVRGLAGETREEALRMLRFGVADGDSDAADALAVMGDLESLEAVRALVKTSHGSARVRAALAAHQLSPDPALAVCLVEEMKAAAHWGDRVDAAMGLRHFRGASDEEALLEAVARDPDYLVRYHACESLLGRWGIRPARIAEHRDIFDRIRGPHEGSPSAEDFARYAEARETLVSLRR
jgi:hypothetical protein